MKPNPEKKEITKFFILVFILSVPFWLFGYFVDLSGKVPVNIPISALMLFCPGIAAVILIPKGRVKELLKRVFDYQKITNLFWYIPIFFLMPALMFLTFLLMNRLQITLPKFEIKTTDALFLTILFFIAAIAEELGWTGYATAVLQKKESPLKTALIIGIVWAIWHIIPFWQAHRNTSWIFWQCVGTIALRIIFVWLYNKSGQSLFAIIICHTTVNLSEFYFPNYGSHYNPFYFGIILILTAAVISLSGLTESESLNDK